MPAHPKKSFLAAKLRPGRASLLDYCLYLHDIFMAQQADRNPARTYVTPAQLAVDLEMTERTIKRYLKYMRESLDLPVGHIRAHGGQGYTRPVSSFPTQNVSEGQFLLFVMARKSLESGSPFATQLRPMSQQLEATLQQKTTANLRDFEDIISFHSWGFDAPVIPDPVIFDAVFKAALEREIITVVHRKAARNARPTLRRIKPLRIRMINRAWYLFNADPVTGEIKKFALNRIKEVTPTREHFDPISLDMQKELADCLGAFTGAKPVHVELRITGNAADLVQERNIHPSQQFTENADGSLTMQLDIGHTIELENWILTLRDEVEVLQPSDLRKAIQGIHQRAAAKYGGN